MDVFVADWLNLALRWARLVVGIGWIGTSFYFIALDCGLRREQGAAPGVLGAAWQVHGGGFYHVEKYAAVQSNAMPLGNETRMTAAEREALGVWLRAQP
jgi:uncharacterized membrane protein